MCMICGVADPTHEQAMMTVAALVVGGAGGLLVPWHVLEEPVRKAGSLLGHRSTPETVVDASAEPTPAVASPTNP